MPINTPGIASKTLSHSLQACMHSDFALRDPFWMYVNEEQDEKKAYGWINMDA